MIRTAVQRAFDFFRNAEGSTARPAPWVDVDGCKVPILFQKNVQARRYRLYVDRKGQPRVTIPRRGTRLEAERFAGRHQDWLVGQLRRVTERLRQRRAWTAGTEVFYRGERQALRLVGHDGIPTSSQLWIGSELLCSIPLARDTTEDLQPWVEGHLRRIATTEFPGQLLALAEVHRCVVKRVTVRNQRSRWGSCSGRGTVSLNWRLVQAPPAVCDYVMIHELMHLREMNHSRRFWKCVAEACPDYKIHERWLREHERLILGQ